MRAYIESYGCGHNESDARIIRALLEQEGVKIIKSPRSADFILINTCGVKPTTEKRMLSRIRALAKCPGVLVVCGCLPKINEKAIRKAVPKAVLIDTDSLGKIPELLRRPRDFLSGKRSNKLRLPQKHGLVAVIQIGEGCTGSCAFCGTKNARGALHSYPLGDIVAVCARSVRNGAREIRLTSEDTGCYGLDIGSSLPELITAVAAIPGEFMVRVGMMNPDHALRLLPRLLEAYGSEKVYKFAHLPVQSGSDTVLKAMRRPYTTAQFERVVAAFRSRFPSITIVTDIIVGFPTENEGDFRKTLALLERVRPDIVHVSRFGPRPGTEAAKMRSLTSQALKRRSLEAAKLAKILTLEANRRFAGGEYDTFALERGRKGNVIGRTPNYKQLAFVGSLGKRYRVLAVAAFPNYLAAQRLK